MSPYLDEALQAVADLKCVDCKYFSPHGSGEFNLSRCRHPEAEAPITKAPAFAPIMREPHAPCGLNGTLWTPNHEGSSYE